MYREKSCVVHGTGDLDVSSSNTKRLGCWCAKSGHSCVLAIGLWCFGDSTAAIVGRLDL